MNLVSYLGLFYLLLLGIPIYWLNNKLKIEINKTTSIAVIRMFIQLAIVGVYLQYIFDLNSWLLNLSYFLIMILIASYSTIKSCELKARALIFPITIATLIPNILMILFFNYVVISLENLFDARYLITIGGMILGNVLNGNIVGINTFYQQVLANQNKINYDLTIGATRFQAIKPYLRSAIKSSIKPMIATIASIGLVSLPGMMTGQILGGAVPIEAILYQIAIMLSIFITRYYNLIIAILISLNTTFDQQDRLILTNFVAKK